MPAIEQIQVMPFHEKLRVMEGISDDISRAEEVRPLVDCRRRPSEGRLIRDQAWEMCTLFDINFLPRKMSVEELQNGFLQLVKRLYSAKETRERRIGYWKRLKQSRRAERLEAVVA